MKGPRLVTQQKVLAETGKFIERFFDSGLDELGDKLGPVLWQFAPFKKFDEADFGKFLEHLPENLNGRRLNHVVEVRHASFQDPAFIGLLRDHGVAPVYVDSEDYPSIADLTGEIVYARLQNGDDAIETGYAPKDLDDWAARAKVWAAGGCAGRSAGRGQPHIHRTPSRATCSSISSMKESCGRPPPPWGSSSGWS